MSIRVTGHDHRKWAPLIHVPSPHESFYRFLNSLMAHAVIFILSCREFLRKIRNFSQFLQITDRLCSLLHSINEVVMLSAAQCCVNEERSILFTSAIFLSAATITFTVNENFLYFITFPHIFLCVPSRCGRFRHKGRIRLACRNFTSLGHPHNNDRCYLISQMSRRIILMQLSPQVNLPTNDTRDRQRSPNQYLRLSTNSQHQI